MEAGATGNEATTVRAFYRLVRGRVDVMSTTAIALLDGQVIRINADAAVTVAAPPLPSPTPRRASDAATRSSSVSILCPMRPGS